MKRVTTPDFTINFMDSPAARSRPTIPITRMAWSKDSTFLAALALSKDTAHITVWNMKDWDSSNPQDTTNLQQNCTVAATPKHLGVDLQGLSIGLSISPDGDQVAVYQEPLIGQWADRSDLKEDRSHFPIRLLTLRPAQDVTVNIESPNPVTRHTSDMSAPPSSSSTDDGATMELLNLEERSHWNQQNVQSRTPHLTLKDFIGYGTFLVGGRSNWDMSDFADARSSSCSDQSTTDNNKKFATCNGIYMDIFRIESEFNWEHTHSIMLTDLMPTINRRITCKAMMDAIRSNKFMWLQDNGLFCTIWDLYKGSNISYISSSDNTRLGSSTSGNSTMSISPDESIVALAGVNGVLTTFYASTGITIDSRRFKDHRIEYVAFNGRDNQLLVIIRHIANQMLKSWILDPIQLESGVQAKQVPVPIIGRTIHGFFRDKSCNHKGLVCEADGSKIHCYVAQESVDVTSNGGNFTVVKPYETSYPSLNDRQQAGHEGTAEEPQEGISEEAGGTTNTEAKNGHQDRRYEVRTTNHRKQFQNGDNSMCWVLGVEVVEIVENPDHRGEEIVFSFVPEPWMRVSTAAVRQPGDLLRVYLLPGQERFIVVGVQTMQIWSLPTKENNYFNLAFIWSCPRTKGNNWTEVKGYRSEPVGEYYHYIRGQQIILDHHTGKARAVILLKERKDIIDIPDEFCGYIYPVFINCARSIHLLSAAYAYSSRKSERFSKGLDKPPLTYKEHAEAIARFTRIHINQLLPCESFYPPPPEIKEAHPTSTPISLPPLPLQSEPMSIQSGALSLQSGAISLQSGAISLQSAPIQELDQITSVQTTDQVTDQATDQATSRRRRSRGQIPGVIKRGMTRLMNLGGGQRREPSGQTTPTARDPGNCVLKISRDVPPSPKKLPNVVHQTFPKIANSVEPHMGKPPPKDESESSQHFVTVLTLLLDQKKDMNDANHVFVEGLFTTADKEWTPHPNVTLNPIVRVVDIRNERLLKALIDYCIRNAKDHHPGYLTPVIQCLSKISERYPDIVRDLFRRASFIPARNPDYVASHAIIANLRRSDWFTFLARLYSVGLFRVRSDDKSSDINDYKSPVFSVRSQLSVKYPHKKRETTFPARNMEQEQPTVVKRSRKIYVSPFQFNPINGQSTSLLAQIAGKDFFDSPAIVASLWYKW